VLVYSIDVRAADACVFSSHHQRWGRSAKLATSSEWANIIVGHVAAVQ